MNILVGIPIFRIADLTRRCLEALVDTPATILAIDNNADEDIKILLRNEFPDVLVIRNDVNGYCNGGWNQIMELGLDGDYDVIGLGSSDVIMHPHWYEMIQERVSRFSNEILVPSIGLPCDHPDSNNIEYAKGEVAGFFSFLPRKAVELVYPIPRTLKHWFGDQYMFTKLKVNGWHMAIMQDVRAFHEQSAVSAANPLTADIIEQDKLAWRELLNTDLFGVSI